MTMPEEEFESNFYLKTLAGRATYFQASISAINPRLENVSHVIHSEMSPILFGGEDG